MGATASGEFEEAQHDVALIRDYYRSSLDLLEKARASHDAVRAHCIKERVQIINSLRRSAEEALTELQHALEAGDSSEVMHRRAQIASLRDKAKLALDEAIRC